MVINICLVYDNTKNSASSPIYKTARLSNHIFLDIELVRIFDRSLSENIPYLVELDSINYEGWVNRQRKYWESEKGLSIAYHIKSNSVWIVPLNNNSSR